MSTPPEPLPTDLQIESALLALVFHRGQTASACPSEVARQLQNEAWRALMPRIRQVAAVLAKRGEIIITQRGETVSPTGPWVGPIRIKIAPPKV